MKLKSKILILSLAAVLIPVGVFAGGKMAKDNIYVSADQIIDGNFVAAGNNVTIEGTVSGDVIVAGKNIFISGPISGDVIAFGSKIQVVGPVQGDVRLVGGNVRVDGVVGKNASLVGGFVELSQDSAVGWGVLAVAGQLDILGMVSKDVRAIATSVLINGRIGEDVKIKLVKREKLTLQPKAWIGGDLDYSSKKLAEVMTGATIVGEVMFNPIPVESMFSNNWKAGMGFSVLLMIAVKLAGLCLLGVILLKLVPKRLEGAIQMMNKRPWPSLGWGALALIFVPAVSLVLFLLVVGWPVSLMMMALYVVTFLFGVIVVSTASGEWLLKRITKRYWRGVSQTWSMVIGVALFVLITSIPILGCLIKFVAVSAGFGASLLWCEKKR